jgi:predicted Zn-dependent peptidase
VLFVTFVPVRGSSRRRVQLDGSRCRNKFTMHRRLLSLSFVLTLIAAHALAQAPDRSVAPKPGPVAALTPPAVQKRTLSNGLPVWIVEMHKVPVASVTLAVKAGAAADPRGKFGLANLTAEMLDEGAGSRGALEIADAVDYLGASLSTSGGVDSSSVDLHVPVARLAEALPIMADVALRPTFPDTELKRVREELLTSLLQAEDDPASLVQFAFPRIVYGAGHRYGTLSFGTAAAIKGFSSDDLRQFHAGHYVPSQSLLIVTGDVTPDTVLPQLERAFGQWKGTAAADAPVPAAPQLQSRKIYIVDKPGAAQSQIAIGWVGVPRSTPDYFALRVLNTVLGGAFTSRLNQNLRETHGYAYGASSAFDMRASAGPFVASAGVQTDKTAEALTEFFKELEGIRAPIPAAEMDKARNYLALLLPRSFETTGSVAGSLEQQFVYGLPQDYFSTYTGRVRAVTGAEVQAAAQKYIQPGKFAVVIVGDRKVIEPAVAALKLGPLVTVTVAEVMK